MNDLYLKYYKVCEEKEKKKGKHFVNYEYFCFINFILKVYSLYIALGMIHGVGRLLLVLGLVGCIIFLSRWMVKLGI